MEKSSSGDTNYFWAFRNYSLDSSLSYSKEI